MSKIWTKQEDDFMIDEINRHPHKKPHEITSYLYDNPLYKERTFPAIYQHVEYLRSKQRADRIE
jgi:hypothetical protein